MTDELIERIKAAMRSDDMPDFDYVQDMEARILADAKIIKAAEELADAFLAEEKTAGQDVWAKLDACEVTDNALAAYRAAVEERDT